MARQAHGFFDLAVAFVFPDQQRPNLAGIVEIASHKPRRDHVHLFTVLPCAESKEVTVPSTPLFSPAFMGIVTFC